MEIKTVEATKALSFTLKTTLANLVNDVKQKPAELIEIASQHSLPISGPQIWIYEGCDGQHDKPFDLTITAPVEASENKKIGEFDLINLPEYTCATAVHKGAYDGLGAAYESLMKDIFAAGYTLDGSNREVYLNCDFEKPENCVTEIQVGIRR